MDTSIHIGMHALINLIISIASIFFCWRILLLIKLEEILKIRRPQQLLWVMSTLSIVLGHNIAKFLIDYYEWSSMLIHLVQ